MNREQKAEVVASLKQNFSDSKASFLVGVKGLNVSQMQSLRRDLHSIGGQLKVAKARLMKLAVDGMPQAECITPYLKDQVGLVFVRQDVSAIAKALNGFAKENEKLSIVVGCLDQHLLQKHDIERIAMLPSREVLLAKVAATLKAPITGLVMALHQVNMRLLWALKAVEQKK